ncbi:MAG: O-antigen polysaccharide polymerase Wzy [bacterium]
MTVVSVSAAILHFIVFSYSKDSDVYLFLAISSLILFFHALCCIWLFKGNLIITFRYLLLFIPMILTSITWLLWKGEVYLSPWGLPYQTITTTSSVVMSGALSVFGCSAGWFAGFIKKTKFDFNLFLRVIERKISIILWSGLVMSLFWSGLWLLLAGGPLGGGRTYAEDVCGGWVTRRLGFQLNVFGVFWSIGIALIMIALQYVTNWKKTTFVLGVISLLFAISTGARCETLLPLLLLVFYFLSTHTYCFRCIHGASVNTLSFPGHHAGAYSNINSRYYLLLVTLMITGFLFSNGIRYWRASGSQSFAETQMDVLKDKDNLLFLHVVDKYVGDKKVLNIETAWSMIGGLYGMIVKTSSGEMNFLLGKSYFNYFLSLPPAFLGLPRPQGLEWQTSVRSTLMSMGGIFETAEAYANFGYFGCFIISFFLSFFFSWLLRRVHEKNSLFFLTWYLVNGLMLARGVWYQNFAFFRIASLFCLIWIMLRLVDERYIHYNPHKLCSYHFET